jgi:hypothetical protein
MTAKHRSKLAWGVDYVVGIWVFTRRLLDLIRPFYGKENQRRPKVRLETRPAKAIAPGEQVDSVEYSVMLMAFVVHAACWSVSNTISVGDVCVRLCIHTLYISAPCFYLMTVREK